MKKILVVLCLLFLSQSAFANDYVHWNTIAPPEYATAIYQKDNTFAGNHPVWNALSCYTIVGIPFAIASKKKSLNIQENNYWYQRRMAFEEQKALCEQIKDHDKQIENLMQLKQSELQKNIDRDTHKEQSMLQRQQINALYNINNSINRPRTFYNYGNFGVSY